MLRSAVFTLQGDGAAAEADLRAAIHIDPDAPAPNRARLASQHAGERIAAAKSLLRAAEADNRNEGFAALAREGVACVGLLDLLDGALVAELAWNGPASIELVIRTDVDERRVPVQPVNGPRPLGFAYSGRMSVALPFQGAVVTVTAPELKSLFEPASLLLPPRPFAPRQDRSATGYQPLIIVPVYRDSAATLACLESIFASQPEGKPPNIVVVDDASPDAALSAKLDELAACGRIRLLRNAINMGFAGSINRAWTLRLPGQDVLLLNADTIVPPGAIEGLASHVRRDPSIGTVTALSNNGEDTSFPQRFRVNPMPTPSAIAEMQEITARINAGRAVDMPNGVGFCLYLRGALCEMLGPLSQRFGRGYYEDVEFCLRAAEAGYRNVCAADVYVGHHGSRSFADGKRALVVRNLRRLSAFYPSYLSRARAFETDDPLREPIARVEEEMLRKPSGFELVVLPSDTPSLLAKFIMAGLAQSGHRPIAARVKETKDGLEITLAGADGAAPQNIVWRCPHDAPEDLLQRLFALPIRAITLLDANDLPKDLIAAVARLPVDARLLIARPARPQTGEFSTAPLIALTPVIRAAMIARKDRDDVEVLAAPDLPQLQPPGLTKVNGVVAVVGIEGRDEDVALLRALAKAMNDSTARPSIIVAGSLPSHVVSSLPEAIHVSGPVGDEELPGWIARLGPQAVFFANRKWGMADLRVPAWAAAGMAVAYFGDDIPAGCRDAHCLILSQNAAPAALANAIAEWLSSGGP
jgi:GT2 family glycosyltransferase